MNGQVQPPNGSAQMNRKPKILHLITSLSVGGAENHLKILLTGLSREKYDLEVAYFKTVGNSRAMNDDFAGLGLTVHDLKGGRRLDPGVLIRLRRLLDRGGFDLLHTHLFRADLYGAAAAAWRPGLKVINSVHNPEDFYAKGWVAALARRAAARQAGTIVISRAVGRHLTDCLNLPEEKQHLVYYGLDPGSPTGLDIRAQYGIPADAPVIGTVGRLAKQKGHVHLIRAMARVARQVPDVRLMIVGRDDQGLGQRLTVEAGKLGLGNRVVLAGFREEIPDIMSAFDVFCLPSLWEGFGLVLLEAMAESRPVVATRAGSIPEVVEDDRTGILVEPGDERGLAEALISLLSDPQRAGEMGRAGRDRQAKVFSVASMIRSTEEFYDQLLNGQSRSPR